MTGCDFTGSRMRRDWGSLFRHQKSRIRVWMLESLTEPGRGGYRLGVIRQDDDVAATVFEAFAWGLIADFFVSIDRADLGMNPVTTVSCGMSLG
jgi:hypothetical protein